MNQDKFHALRILLRFSLLDSMSSWLLIILYLTGIDVVWLVNLNFSVMTVCLMYFALKNIRFNWLSLFIVIVIGLSFLKMMLFYEGARSFEFNHLASYFLGLLIPLFALIFVSQFSAEDLPQLERMLHIYAKRFLTLALPGLISYSVLFFMGYIDYFGLGSNLYYIFPFFMKTGANRGALAFLLLALLTGKRASLITLMGQFAIKHVEKIRKMRLAALFSISVVLIGMIYLYEATSLLDRFKWMFEGEMDFSDPYFLSISGGGRFEEIFGIVEYFSKYPLDLVFGAPPGGYYSWELEWSDYVATKNYSHITWFGYVFRYGLLFTSVVLILFVHKFITNLGNSRPLYIVFVGIFMASFFGALLIIDPTSWLLIGLFLQTSRKKYHSSAI